MANNVASTFVKYFPMYWQSLQEAPSSCEQSSYCAGQLGGCGLMYGIVCMLFLTERKCIKMKTVLPQQPHLVCASVYIGLRFFFRHMCIICQICLCRCQVLHAQLHTYMYTYIQCFFAFCIFFVVVVVLIVSSPLVKTSSLIRYLKQIISMSVCVFQEWGTFGYILIWQFHQKRKLDQR